MMRALTFNISAGNCSAYATNLSLQDKYQRVVQLIKQHDPHLISLQELDEMASQTIGGGLAADYTHLGSAESHCGSTHIWALHSLQASPMPSAGCVAMAKIPLPLPEGMSGTAGSAGYFVFAGCHLEPFSDGAPMRLKQLEVALRSMPPRCRLVLAGDLNMRNAEEPSVEGLGLSDASKWAGSKALFTWNSSINKYHGPEQRSYTARYDRVYLRGWSCQQLQLIANEPVTPGHLDYLSDHFGLLATLQLLP
ncbi:Tyrosyl-DNA phosphodiesterase 2 [Chlorella vulgaris]